MHYVKKSTTALAAAAVSTTYWNRRNVWRCSPYGSGRSASLLRSFRCTWLKDSATGRCCTFGGHLGLSAGHSGPLLPQSVPLRRTSDRVDPQLTLPHLLRGLNWYSSCVSGLVSYRRSNRLKTFWVTDVTLGFFIEPIPLIVKWIQFYF